MKDINAFIKMAEYLEDTYGVQYDRDEQFVICGECGEPIYFDDWEEHEFSSLRPDLGIEYRCPICETNF